MSEPLPKTQPQVFLPSKIFTELIHSPMFAGAVAMSVASIPVIPYNNIMFYASHQNPSFKDIRETCKIIIKREGFWSFKRNGRGLMRCASPALAGQYFYGGCLFELFEGFRGQFLADDKINENGRTRNTLSEIGLSALGAEFYAVFLLAPFEVAYAMMMMHKKDFPQTLGLAFKELAAKPGMYKFPFGPLKTLIATGMPKTALTFTLFEIFSVLFAAPLIQKAQDDVRRALADAARDPSLHNKNIKKEMFLPSRASQLNVSFSAGVAAGFCYEVILHPFNQYLDFSKKINFQFEINRRAKDIVDGESVVNEFFRNRDPFPHEHGTNGGKPSFGQKFSFWMRMQGSNPRALWRGFGPKLWMGSFSGGVMWLTYDLITGRNRVQMPKA